MPGYKPETWEVTQGCTKVSEGCRNCWAKRLAEGRLKHLYPDGFGQVVERWDKLMASTHWREPRAVFVSSRSDLFHPDVSWPFIFEVFSQMMACNRDHRPWGQHRFFLLTKRPERMLEFITEHNRYLGFTSQFEETLRPWPANAIAMTGAEDQKTLDWRMGYLAQVPAPLRGLILEPLLGPVDVSWYLMPHHEHKRPGLKPAIETVCGGSYRMLDWVVVGFESGLNARDGEIQWILDVIDQCREAGVRVFVKQLGTAWARKVGARDWKGEDPAEWPVDLEVREWPRW
jgi:protein gp37